MPIQFVATSAGIANQALRHLGNSEQITGLTENSANAAACSAFYDTTRDEVLREFNWPFARRYATLVLVGGTATVPVTMDWQYSYRVPTDCLKARRLLPGTRLDVPETRWSFSIGGDSTGGLLYTEMPYVAATATTPQLPQLEYTAEITAEARFPADFAQAFACKLAFYLSPALTQGGDQFKLGQRALGMYSQLLAQAEANAMNEQQPDPAPESEFIRTR